MRHFRSIDKARWQPAHMSIVATLFLFIAFCRPVFAADYIVNTGPGSTDPSLAFVLGFTHDSFGNINDVEWAGRFTISTAVTLGTVELWLNSAGGSLAVVIRSDSAGVPGSILFSKTYIVPHGCSVVPVCQGSPVVWIPFPNLGASLNAGTYWVSFEGVDPGPQGFKGGIYTGAQQPLSKTMVGVHHIAGPNPGVNGWFDAASNQAMAVRIASAFDTLSAPTNLSAQESDDGTAITLGWDYNTSNAVDGFILERKPGEPADVTADWQLLPTHLIAGDRTYIDMDVIRFAKYSYRISAFRGTTQSPPSNTATAGATPSADLSISPSDIVPTQGVYNVNINGGDKLDLVSGRPTAITAHITVTNTEALNALQPVDVELTFQGATQKVTRTVTQLKSAPDDMPNVGFVVTPTGSGDFLISINIDPDNVIAESNETDNNEALLPVSVKLVNALTVAYVKVDYRDPTPEFARTVVDSVDYVRAVFPVDPHHFTNFVVPVPYLPHAIQSYVPLLGLFYDAGMLWIEAHLLPGLSPDRVVAIVPQHYFNANLLFDFAGAHVPPGITLPMLHDVAFVLDGHPLVTAHELGHTFFLGEGYTKHADGTCCVSDGAATHGFWVEQQRVIESIDYMGTTAPVFPFPAGAAQRWATTANFTNLFQQFLVHPDDPEVLLVTGTISQNGVAAFGRMYRALGNVSRPTNGESFIRLLDVGNRIISEMPFHIDFDVFDAPGISPLTDAPFAFALPFAPNAAKVEILGEAGQVIGRIDIVGQLLASAIAELPDAAFKMEASQRRTALLNKISALDKQIAAGAFTGARENLANDIRKRLEDWVKDDYPIQAPRQYTKTQLLLLVDELVGRLGL